MKLLSNYILLTLSLIIFSCAYLNAQNAFDLKMANTKPTKSTTNAKHLGQQLHKWKKTKSFSKTSNTLTATVDTKSFKQIDLSSALKNQNLKITYNENEVPYFILNSSKKAKKAALTTTALKQAAAQKFLVNKKEILKINNPEKELKLSNTNTDKKGYTHFKYKQLYKDLPVWASEIIVHVNNNEVYCLNGRYQATRETVNNNPEISAEAAIV